MEAWGLKLCMNWIQISNCSVCKYKAVSHHLQNPTSHPVTKMPHKFLVLLKCLHGKELLRALHCDRHNPSQLILGCIITVTTWLHGTFLWLALSNENFTLMMLSPLFLLLCHVSALPKTAAYMWPNGSYGCCQSALQAYLPLVCTAEW